MEVQYTMTLLEVYHQNLLNEIPVFRGVKQREKSKLAELSGSIILSRK